MGLRALATESTGVHIGGYLRPQLLFQLDPRRLPDRAGCMIIHARQPTWIRASAAFRARCVADQLTDDCSVSTGVRKELGELF